MNPTLISGFEDIMTHIKNQGKQIEALQANEKVREERTQELYLENQQLQEENKKLKALVDGEWRCADAENEHPEDAVAKEGFASEAEYQAWKKKAMGIPVEY